ncbi:hypothetical protein HPP92_013217 [Vanilla planifolia]|uniref:Uncharacterized protein n=1 Tax=Vanilla planifolia TaxID=51239 RepID=A0A835QV78_VANPL|nr:hypothetical protein HPP92_013217 [Vanilla planifolia]
MAASRFCYSSISRPPPPCFLDKSHTLLNHLAKPIPSLCTGIRCGLQGRTEEATVEETCAVDGSNSGRSGA